MNVRLVVAAEIDKALVRQDPAAIRDTVPREVFFSRTVRSGAPAASKPTGLVENTGAREIENELRVRR